MLLLVKQIVNSKAIDLCPHPCYIVGMRRKPEIERKEEMVRVRMTAEQKALFTKAAQEMGLDLSGWLRYVALKEAKSAGLLISPT